MEFEPRSANSCPLTPLGLLERAAIAYDDCISLVYNTNTTSYTYTWSQTRLRCLRVASWLHGISIGRGHIVSVLAPNIPPMYELHFAIPMSGAILNTLNTRLDPKTISVLLAHSESRIVFVDAQYSSLVLEAVSLFPPDVKRPLLVLIVDTDAPFDCDHTEFLTTYEIIVDQGDPGFEWIRPESEYDPMVLNYTSGTTSAPKGVIHSHRAIYLITINSLVDWSVQKHPVYLWTLPMFHSNGWSFTWGIAAVGGTNVCLRKFDTGKVFDLIKSHRVTHMCGAPIILNMLCNHITDDQVLPHPVNVITAGSPPPAPVLLRAESIGFMITHGYGMTEAGGVMVSCEWKTKWNELEPEERAKLKARQGVRTIGLADANVLDKTGEIVPKDGQSLGEIVFKGPCLMSGYYKDTAATTSCMRQDGWFYTGDAGVMHSDGYIEIKDRFKDVIISGGENICSAEIEGVLYGHEMVNEAAVVGRPDELWGERPWAFISLRNGKSFDRIGESEIIKFCRNNMASFMVPKRVVFLDELPKTETGKIQKSLLREIAKTTC